MLYGSIALFALAAVFGLIILIKWLQKKDASKGVVYTHGLLAAIALVLVIIFSIQNPNNFPKISLILFVIAAVFGFYMFFRDLMKKMSPMAVAVIHALIAVSGFVGLLLFAIG